MAPDSTGIPVLPGLERLTLYPLGYSAIARILDPAIVPRLQHFALFDPWARSVPQLKQSRLEQLLTQLETLVLPAYFWTLTDPELCFIRSAANRTLVDRHVDNLAKLEESEAAVIHLRIYNLESDNEDLESWTSALEASRSLSLSSLYLNSSLKPISTLPTTVLDSSKKLMEACKERKIKVVFETVPNDYSRDAWISEEFIRRRKEDKEKNVFRSDSSSR